MVSDSNGVSRVLWAMGGKPLLDRGVFHRNLQPFFFIIIILLHSDNINSVCS